MCPQNNPYMVLTQTAVQRKRPKGPNSSVVEESEDSHGSDVDSDSDKEDWIYYELGKSCDDGFWHDTADTIVSNSGKHLSNNQKARLQKFVLTIAKRIFMFDPLEKPSFTYNLTKGSHVMQVQDKYHVIVRREQNIIHIFACTAKKDDSYVYSWGAEIKKCTRKDALGIQNDPSRLSSNHDQHNSASGSQNSDELTYWDDEASLSDNERRQQRHQAAEERAAALRQRGRPQEESIGRVVHSKGPDAGKARHESMFVHHVRDAVAQEQEGRAAANVPAQNVPAPAQQVQGGAAPNGAERAPAAQGEAAQGGAAPAPQVSNLQPQQREGVPAAQGGAAQGGAAPAPQVSNLQPQQREGVPAARRLPVRSVSEIAHAVRKQELGRMQVSDEGF